MLQPTADGTRVELDSPLELPRASAFLWNRKMMIQITCRGYAIAQFLQPEPAKYAHAPNLEARTFMQPEHPYYAHHPGRFFYVKDEASGALFSAPYEPVRATLDRYLFSALGTIIDKVILTKHMQDPISYQLLYVATELPVLLVLLLFKNVSFAFPWVALGIVAGLSHYLGLFLYFKAMMLEEAYRVIPLFYIGPIFTLILAATVLKENLTSSMYIGVILLVLGAVSISYKRVEGRGTVISPALGLLLLCSFVLSLYEILTKYVLGSLDLTSFFFWELIGFLIAAFFTFCHPRIRQSFLTSVRGLKRHILFWRSVNTYMSLIALILYFAAMSVGLASLVSGATSFEPFFVLVFALLFSYFVPHVLKEDIGKGALVMKAVAVALIVAGAWLIAG